MDATTTTTRKAKTMKATIGSALIDAAEKIVKADAETEAALWEWYNRTRGNKDDSFGEWLDYIVAYVGQNISADGSEPTAEALAKGVKLQAWGDRNAKAIAESLKDGVTDTDTAAYVEEGRAHVSVWVNCYMDESRGREKAETAKRAFEERGFTAEILADGHDFTMMADIDFSKYAA